jgi:hypothetical protein
LPVIVADDEAQAVVFDIPWQRESALCHHLPVQSKATSKIIKAPGMTRANTNSKNGATPVIFDTRTTAGASIA